MEQSTVWSLVLLLQLGVDGGVGVTAFETGFEYASLKECVAAGQRIETVQRMKSEELDSELKSLRDLLGGSGLNPENLDEELGYVWERRNENFTDTELGEIGRLLSESGRLEELDETPLTLSDAAIIEEVLLETRPDLYDQLTVTVSDLQEVVALWGPAGPPYSTPSPTRRLSPQCLPKADHR